jgi:Caspase domain
MQSRNFSWKYILAAVAVLSLLFAPAVFGSLPAFADKHGHGGGGGGGRCPPPLVRKGGACVQRGQGGGNQGGNQANENRRDGKRGGNQQGNQQQDAGPKGGKHRGDRDKHQAGGNDDGKHQGGQGQGGGGDGGEGGGNAQGGKQDHDDDHPGDRGRNDDKPQAVDCKSPLIYSREAHGCVNPGNGPEHAKCERPFHYSERQERCVKDDDDGPHHANCERPYYYSEREERCVRDDEHIPVVCRWPFVPAGLGCICAPGLIPRGDSCERPPVIVVDPGHPGRDGPPPFVPLPPDEGPPPGPPPGNGPPPEDAGPPQEKPIAIKQGEPAPTERCLPQDLYDLVVDTYGKRPGLTVCPPPCLPKPLAYSQGDLDKIAKKGGIEWCENCLEVGSYMPLPAILELESRANLTICVDPSLCRLPPVYVDRQTEVRTIYADLPAGIKNEGNLAVVVGNQDYQNDLPANAYGKSDADAVKALLIDQLGYKQENIIYLRDGTLKDFERVFGSESDPGGEIAKRIDKQDPGDVFVYVASHGMVKEDDLKQAYLLPVDAKLDALDDTAYGLQKLYENLGKTGARTTMLLLEGNFAKNLDELINPPNLPELEVETMPTSPIAGLVVLKASDRDQRTIEDPEYGIGLFTRYMIEGFAGKADDAPLGNGDKRIDTVELYVYTSDMVRQAARKSFGLEQKPMLSKIDNLVVGQIAGKQ